MTAEQQLERSVLESKERDELHAIAQAMSLKTTSRTKKADIIDRILTATGVSVDNTQHPSPPPNGATAAKNAPEVENAPEASASQETSAGPESIGAPESIGKRSGSGPSGTAASINGVGERPGLTGSSTGSFVAASSTYEEGARSQQQANGRSQGGQRQQGQQSQQSRHSSQGPQAGQPGNVEVGNRRGRRRRGRERVPGGGGGELQGSGHQEGAYQGELVEVRGLLDLRDEGYGFLRCEGYLPSDKDVYVSISQARRFALRKGDYVEGACRPAANNEKYPALLRIDTVSALDPEEARTRPRFEDLTPLFPDSRLHLEMPGSKENVTARIVDLLSPIGKGQRGLIVSPPKAGKTTVMKQIAHSIEANNPEVHLMVLLVDERPEEVTDMRRSVRGEVVASTFDRPSEEHTAVAELAIERAKRLVEVGKDVVIILDGITRLARAYNLAAPATGRIMSGGVDSGALYPPKKFFGAARNIEEGGSLTILATALVETGSKMDEVIFEEFKGTGNMELRLDRRLAERRLYPSIDVNASSTRHEELLFDRGQLQQVWKLRRVLNALASDGNAASGLELLMDKIRTTQSNDEFLAEIAKGPTPNN